MGEIFIGLALSIVISFPSLYFLIIYLEKIASPERYKNWKEWKKHNRNNPFYKRAVLFGWAHSPTFESWGSITVKIPAIEAKEGERFKFRDNKSYFKYKGEE